MIKVQKNNNASVGDILDKISSLSVKDSLNYLVGLYENRVVFSTSFSFEDQYLTHLIFSTDLPIEVFTLDTGRMFPETYSVWNATLSRYSKNIKAYYPNAEDLQAFVLEKGPNSFYESVENRKKCCFIRKVEPLKKGLIGKDLWITGLRAEHSPERKEVDILEWDESNQIFKYHPLLHWKTEEVKKEISLHNIPYNPLHDKGFVSIGCQPCTRAVKEGEPFRAGRWWWEDADKKECGLHVHN